MACALGARATRVKAPISPWVCRNSAGADPRVRLEVAAALLLALAALDRSFCCQAVWVGPVKADASCSPRIIEIGSHYIPALAQVQHPVVALRCPALGRNADPRGLGHFNAFPFWTFQSQVQAS